MATFFGLNISRLGMQAQQKALEVTSHNIANANTPGYSRQVAHMEPTAALTYSQKGMLGSGVIVDEVARIRDQFLDRQIRQEQQTLGQWETRSTYLSQVEQLFMEPSETGFSTALSTFFDSWQELSLNPESSPARAVAIESSTTLLNTVRQTYNNLDTIRNDLEAAMALKVKEVNTLAVQISDLNTQITSLTAKNDAPSDLMDRRDLLLDKLAEIINFEYTENKSGSVNILVGGRSLVHENTTYALTLADGGSDNGWPLSPQIVWEKDGGPAQVTNGELYGLSSTRDNELRRYMEDFESMTWAIVNAVNTAHRAGIDLNGEQGEDFFTGTHLNSLSVNINIINAPEKIAASTPPAGTPPFEPIPGDGSNAVRIAQLRNGRYRVDMSETDLHQRVQYDPNGVSTLETLYRDNIARLGVDSQESTRMVENQTALMEMMTTRRSAISSVSLDEEMANMVQFQLAYQASARVITTLDEIYDTLINRMI